LVTVRTRSPLSVRWAVGVAERKMAKSAVTHFGVERVAQRVAEQAEAEHRHCDC
jgi:hypothetical protein